jgi:hypothetical protein
MPEPRIETVKIQWLDEQDKDGYWAKVAINQIWDEQSDDGDIFFYFETEEEYQRAKTEDSGQEFRIVEED